MDNLEIEVPQTAGAAEAEKDKAAAVAGKFKDVKALEEAYLSLQAEFTRRSQKLKELEASIAKGMPENADAQTENADTKTEQKSPAFSTVSPNLLDAAMADESVKEAIIADYLKTVSNKKSVPLIFGGVQVAAQRQTPKSVREAGFLASEFLSGK